MKLNRKALTISLALSLVFSAAVPAQPQKNCLLFPSITLSSCSKADNISNDNKKDNSGDADGSEDITYKFKIIEVIKNLFD